MNRLWALVTAHGKAVEMKNLCRSWAALLASISEHQRSGFLEPFVLYLSS